MIIEQISLCEIKIGAKTFPCAIGKNGISSSKKEGDSKTPTGLHKVTHVYYRPDKLMLNDDYVVPCSPLTPYDGWCDDPDSPFYNQFVKLPFDNSHENLWRDDDRYNIILVTDYNTNPAKKGKGSAIFIHCAERNKAGDFLITEGCLALNQSDLLTILETLKTDDIIWKISKYFK